VTPAAAPIASATPVAAPIASATPAPSATPVELLPKGDAPERIPLPRDPLALHRAFRDAAPIAPIATAVGDIGAGEQFWLRDPAEGTPRRITAILRYRGPIVALYVDVTSSVDQGALERAGQQFEQEIYPRIRAIFGAEQRPSGAADRITVLNTNLRGAGGYFSPQDWLPAEIDRFSNQRAMFVIGINSYPIGSEGYLATLAHEFVHMIDFSNHRRRAGWLSEGLAMLGEERLGFLQPGAEARYFAGPPVQLTSWSTDAGAVSAHYAASRLFVRYVDHQYLRQRGLDPLMQADAAPEAVLGRLTGRCCDDARAFADLVADWGVANLLDDPTIDEGRYAYPGLERTAVPLAPDSAGARAADAAPFAPQYHGPWGGGMLEFRGATSVALGPPARDATPIWWSQRDDQSTSTLTVPLALGAAPELRFATWYEFEPGYDYGFVSLSTDGGARWVTLASEITTSDDPHGQNYGAGVTGASGGWRDVRVDLGQYAGRQVLLRFWAVTDAALNGAGWFIGDVRLDGRSITAGWQPQGFVVTTLDQPQRWTLRVIRRQAAATRVEPVDVAADGTARVSIADDETVVLMVMASTPGTTRSAPYWLAGTPAR
jgi:hypothetical protein